MSHLLEVKNLQTHFPTRAGLVKAVNDVSFHIDEGELVGLVGESGCGKSITALSVMRLIAPPGKIVGGEILFKGENLLRFSDDKMREIRGNDIAMIFQDPMTSLNPVYTVGEQIAEALRLHRNLDKKAAWREAVEAMKEVSIPDPSRRASDYPHQLSGGMRQRVMIAMALACNPELLIADEPTTALDVTIQARILELLDELRRTRKLSVLLITHDLGVVAEVADRVCVMYTGRIVEESGVEEIFQKPKHPYTEGLLKSVPKLREFGDEKLSRLSTIQGTVPSPTALPPGCHFAPRCPYRFERCTRDPMPLFALETTSKFAAFYMKEKILQGRRVYLRRPKPEDCGEFTRLSKASRKFHKTLAAPPVDRKDFAEYLERSKSEASESFLICRVSDDAFVGTVNLSQIFHKVFQNAYLGYLLFEEHIGQGLMTEALDLVLKYAFQILKLHRVEANVQPQNVASIEILEKMNFTREGFSRKYLKIGERWRDHERWAIIVEDWRKHK